MRARMRMSRGKDKRIFRKTAARTRKANVPGKVLSRGGLTL